MTVPITWKIYSFYLLLASQLWIFNAWLIFILYTEMLKYNTTNKKYENKNYLLNITMGIAAFYLVFYWNILWFGIAYSSLALHFFHFIAHSQL